MPSGIGISELTVIIILVGAFAVYSLTLLKILTLSRNEFELLLMALVIGAVLFLYYGNLKQIDAIKKDVSASVKNDQPDIADGVAKIEHDIKKLKSSQESIGAKIDGEIELRDAESKKSKSTLEAMQKDSARTIDSLLDEIKKVKASVDVIQKDVDKKIGAMRTSVATERVVPEATGKVVPETTQKSSAVQNGNPLQNEFISISNCRATRSGKDLFVGFVVKNRTQKTIYIALQIYSAIVTDENYATSNHFDVNGIRSSYGNQKDERDYTSLSSGSSTPVTFKFWDGQAKGSRLNCVVKFFQFIDDRIISYEFSVPISVG